MFVVVVAAAAAVSLSSCSCLILLKTNALAESMKRDRVQKKNEQQIVLISSLQNTKIYKTT
jgi:Na+/proline symporter